RRTGYASTRRPGVAWPEGAGAMEAVAYGGEAGAAAVVKEGNQALDRQYRMRSGRPTVTRGKHTPGLRRAGHGETERCERVSPTGSSRRGVVPREPWRIGQRAWITLGTGRSPRGRCGSAA